MNLIKIAFVATGTVGLVLVTASLTILGANEIAKEKFGAPLLDELD